ncbi:MAG: hypothetical protein WCP12_11685, partial [bacterium]
AKPVAVPAPEVKPAVEAKPIVEAKPAAPVEPPAAVTPVAPVVEAKPVAVPVPEVKPAVEAKPIVEAKPAAPKQEQDEIVSELNMLETTRLKSMDDHGFKLLANADRSFKNGDYMLACEQYKQVQLFIVNRPANAVARKKASDGEAESYYAEASQLLKIRELSKAKDMAEEAHRRGHVKASRLLELIKQEPDKAVIDNSSISHRLNEADYKLQRDEIRKRLRRSRQYFTTAEYTKAIEECELVLRDYPGNKEAIELRQNIGEHIQTVSEAEFSATRQMMIKDVVKAWTPDRYAPDSPQLPKNGFEMVTKTQTVTISDTKSSEQVVNKKLKTIVIPEVTFRPPATIVDAIDFFKQASRDYDDPEIPVDQRGVNLILKLASTAAAAPAAATAPAPADPFAAATTAASTGVPVIPAMSARFINLFDALRLVCDVTGMKFRINGNIVMIVPLNDPDEKLMTRSYNVLPTLSERLGSASKELSAPAGGGAARAGEATFMNTESMGGVKDEEKWKEFFKQMGVTWPIGSSISYLTTIGKLRVTNTSEGLATFEQVLEDLNVTPRLVEIETRFVEVSQNDLNSLGFEWLLNGDFSWSAGGFAKNVLGMKDFSNTLVPLLTPGGLQILNPDGSPQMGYAPYTQPGAITDPFYKAGQYGAVPVSGHTMGVNAIDGTPTGYSTGNRYLNSANNAIIGQGGAPINDQFMKLNAFIGGADISMILHMLCQRSDTDVLSAPKVTTKSGQEAIMKVVTEYIYPSEFNVQISQQGNSGGGGGISSGGTGEPIAIVEPQNFTMREVGVILQVVPEVSSEGQMINLTMKPQVVSEPVWKNYGTKLPKTTYEIIAGISVPKTDYVELPMEQPFFTVRSVETQLLVYNGATVVMGGLITEARKTMEDKIPFLGDIPYLGRLFRSKSEKSDKRNLLIFVTARLVDPGGRVVRTGGNETKLSAPGSTPVVPAPVAPPAATPAAGQ